MRVWYFSEMAYHPAWEEGLKGGSLRVVLPNRNFDPKVGHGLLNRYLDEFALCDEVGLDIMVNEHHSTSTCLTVSVPMALAIIARQTKRARLLSLGTPIANRPDPVRVAEEMAWLDVLSGGRPEMGPGKGAPYGITVANGDAASGMQRSERRSQRPVMRRSLALPTWSPTLFGHRRCWLRRSLPHLATTRSLPTSRC